MTRWISEKNGSFQFEEDPFSVNDGAIGEIYHEVLLLMNILQTKHFDKSRNVKCYDLYYTINKYGNEKENVNG